MLQGMVSHRREDNIFINQDQHSSYRQKVGPFTVKHCRKRYHIAQK